MCGWSNLDRAARSVGDQPGHAAAAARPPALVRHRRGRSRPVQPDRVRIPIFSADCLVAASISATAGTLLGLIAGAGSALADGIVMRLMDVMLAFPYILLVLVVVAILGPSLWTGMIAVGVAGIPGYARVVRSAVLSVRHEDYVESARVLGASGAQIMFGTVLPNVLSPLIIYLSFATPLAALLASALSFAGLGAQPPAPEWGAMLVNSRTYLFSAWWAVAAPGTALFVSIFGLNLLGNGLRDILDPRS
jgi:ABC-type dipeptide/oligopeptide/nickel transport system permease subunit